MVPPKIVSHDLAQRTFDVNIAPGRGPCALDGRGAVQIQRRKKKIRVTVNRDALLKQQPGWLTDWSIRAEAQGCVALGSGEDLGNFIVESVPLDPAVAFRLLHTNYIQSGYVDLGPENRLQVYSPILQEGTPADMGAAEISAVSGAGYRIDVDLKTASNAIGVETAWYGIQGNIGRSGYHFVPLSAQRSIQGVVEQAPRPETNFFQFPPEAAFFRLFYKSGDNGVVAIIVVGATREELDHRTRAVSADPATCEKSPGACRILPRSVGVNPYMVVNVNGIDFVVPLWATVSAAIRAAGVKNPDTVLPRLRVTKLFRKRLVPIAFDAKSDDILNLRLIGGERISWNAGP